MSIYSISRETHQNNFNKNMIIKKNIFGHRWVLKVNEQENTKKRPFSKLVLLAYFCVFLSITLAISFGIFVSLDHTIFQAANRNTPNLNYSHIVVDNQNDNGVKLEDIFVLDVTDKNETNKTKANNDTDSGNEEIIQIRPYCQNCTLNQICMKLGETEKPKCVDKVDKRDPTGCGRLCKINIEYCKNLDRHFNVYQCLKLKNFQNCSVNEFSCGYRCILLSQRCDGKVDCRNRMDEKDCNT